jgi:hypothetical protein
MKHKLTGSIKNPCLPQKNKTHKKTKKQKNTVKNKKKHKTNKIFVLPSCTAHISIERSKKVKKIC